MLVEIHMLQNFAPSNLNRDDSNSPKDCIFGGYRRARISSQCLKKSIRDSQYFKESVGNLGFRTRTLPELITEKLISLGMEKEDAEKLGLLKSGTGKSSKKKKNEDEDLPKITNQIMFFSDAEVTEIAKVMKDIYDKNQQASKPLKLDKLYKDEMEKEFKKLNLRKLTPDIALFGRMITDDEFLDIDSAIQVAHAISTNKMEQEFDFFTAVDDILSGKDRSLESQGSAMMGDIEFTSATFYKYFSINIDSYIENLVLDNDSDDEREKAKETVVKSVGAFLKASVYTNPTGKQNTFAAHQLPSAILVEIKEKNTPVSYANAFLLPVKPYGDKDLVESSIDKFLEHVNNLTKKYNLDASKRFWFCEKDSDEIKEKAKDFEEKADINALCEDLEAEIKDKL